MGKGFLTRGLTNKGSYAIIRVSTFNNSTIVCTNIEEDIKTEIIKEYTNTPIEFIVGYGNWKITSTTNSGEKYETELIVDTMRIYDVNLIGNITYGISIDMSNSDPEAAVSYIDSSSGFTPLSVNLDTGVCDYGDWEDIITNIIGCRPCVIAKDVDGNIETIPINPNDYSLFSDEFLKAIDENPINIEFEIDIENGLLIYTYPNKETESYPIDVMVEFKKTWYKYSVDGNILTFQIANYDRSEDGFVCSAFKSMDGSGTVKDYMYYGAYEGYTDSENNKIRSISNKNTNSGGLSFSEIRTYCQNNGSSYGMEDWCKRCYLLGLLMLVTKTRDIQSAIGYGNNAINNSYTKSGTLDKAGLFAGYNTTDKSVKAFGIENLWGNYYSLCDGIITLSSSSIGFKDCPPYNDTGSEYTQIEDGYTRNSELSPTSMISILNGSCITASVGQSDFTKGWCDSFRIYGYSNYVACVGKSNNDNYRYNGPFSTFFYDVPQMGIETYVGRIIAV